MRGGERGFIKKLPYDFVASFRSTGLPAAFARLTQAFGA